MVPNGVNVDLSGQDVSVKGPKGVLSLTLVDDVEAVREDDKVWIKMRSESRRARMMWGMQRTLVNNMITGVSQGFLRELEIHGTGYRASVKGKDLVLLLGYSHDVVYPIPEGIDIKCETPTTIAVSGVDLQRVGQVASEIRAFRKPEPFKAKGVRYKGEYIFRKEGKKK
jgi:large subunit ribosomal protein L6